jgi:hypothetical protein
MMDWTIPSLYILVYLDKRADGFDLVHQVDLERPFVICPDLKGSQWNYLRKKIRSTNTLGLMELVNFSLDNYLLDSGPISTTISQSTEKKRTDYTPLVELMSAHAFIPEDMEDVDEIRSITQKEMKRLGFDSDHFYSEIIRVDFGTAGLHQYCLFGGLNRYVFNILKKQKSKRKGLSEMISTLTQDWHERMASYVGIIMWSKVKVSPLLRATLIDDTLAFRSKKRKRDVESAFQNLVMQAILAFSRKPL